MVQTIKTNAMKWSFCQGSVILCNSVPFELADEVFVERVDHLVHHLLFVPLTVEVDLPPPRRHPRRVSLPPRPPRRCCLNLGYIRTWPGLCKLQGCCNLDKLLELLWAVTFVYSVTEGVKKSLNFADVMCVSPLRDLGRLGLWLVPDRAVEVGEARHSPEFTSQLGSQCFPPWCKRTLFKYLD